MMKKRLLLLAFALSTVLGAVAQRSFTVKLADYAAFAQLNTEDINFRRLPSATSGKLMQWFSDGGSFDTEEVYFFSDENRGRYRANANTGAFVQPLHMSVGTILPVQGTSGEWYKLDMSCFDIKSKSQSAYVMQKFCKSVTRAAITDKSICPVEAGYGASGESAGTITRKVFTRENSQFSDLPMTAVHDITRYSEDGAAATLSIPFFIDDKYVYVVGIYLPITFDSNASSATIEWEEENDEMNGNPYFALQMTMKPYAENKLDNVLNFFFKHISDADFENFLDHALTDQLLANGSTYIKGTDGKYYQVGNLSSNDASAITRTFTFGRGQ